MLKTKLKLINSKERREMDWNPKLKMGDLKPLIGWIQTAMTHLAGADMKPSIIKAFKNDGCMEHSNTL